MAIHILIVYLSLLYGFVISEADICSPGLITDGWTVPKGDIVIEVGNPLEIYCILHPENDDAKYKSAERIVFFRGNELIDNHFITVINKTTAKLHLENLTVSNDMFYCKLSTGDNFNNSSFTPNSLESSKSLETDVKNFKLVCINNVAVGSKPKEVENFTCTSYDWTTLNCSWKTPNNGIKTTYRIRYRTPKRPGRNQIYKCPNDDDIEYNTCSWSSATVPLYRRNFEFLTFIFIAENRFGNFNQSIKFHHYAHILPAAPRALSTISKTTSSICLKWNIAHLQIFEKGFLYKVMYMWNSSSSWNVTIYNQKQLEKNNEEIKLNITNLKYPNTLYDFRIYMRSPIAPDEAKWWSDPASLIVKTKSCPPYTSPKTDIGSFEISDESSTWRIVYIYWQPLSTLEYNGEDFHYSILVFEENKEINVKPLVIKYSYAKFNISVNKHKFFITSVNAEGFANETSVIHIPHKDEILQEPVVFNKIDYGNNEYELSWVPRSIKDVKISNFTLFKCETNRERPFQCDGYVDWVYLKPDITKYNFSNLVADGYQFAISINSETSSSGMIWASCTLQHGKVSKMKDVSVSKVGSTYIDVRWKLECSDRVEGIQGYQIFYCATSSINKTKCNETEKSIIVYGDVTTVHGNITGLKPFTNYKISASIFTSDRTAPRSDYFYSRTSEGAPNVHGSKVEAINITNTTAYIRWDAPVDTNGNLQYYEVSYNKNVIYVYNKTEELLMNLSSFTTYNVFVRACTVECSEPIGPIKIITKIGTPGSINKPNSHRINSTHVVVSWSPPHILAGPNPVYDVRLEQIDSYYNSTINEYEIKDNKTVLQLWNCKNDKSQLSSYTFYVRAKNIDYSNRNKTQYFVGDWSPTYAIECLSPGMSNIVKIILGIFIISAAAFGSLFYGQKGFSKCQQMKNVEVTLPAKFTIPPLFSSDIKDTEYHVNWSDENAESDHLY